jgi:hypothetical protein
MEKITGFLWEWQGVVYYVDIFARKTDSNATTALITLELQEGEQRVTLQNKYRRIRTGIALCHPKDEYSWLTGVWVACRNALNIGHHIFWTSSREDADFDRALWHTIRAYLPEGRP